MWETPLTAVANTGLTAGQWNASVRDNLRETTPGKASAQRKIFVTNGTNQIAERDIKDNIIDQEESTTSTSYVDLTTTGPVVTLDCGNYALVFITCMARNSGNTNSRMSYAVTGVTTTAADDDYANECDGGSGPWHDRSTVSNLHDVNPGSNTFTSKYSVTGGTGRFHRRRIVVMGL